MGAVTYRVNRIFRTCSPVKIFDPIVFRVAIQMAALMAVRCGAYECLQH